MKKTHDVNTEEIVNEQAPDNFSYCFKTDCASADKCLRALAARNLNREKVNLRIINPLVVNAAGEASCPYFRNVERVHVAYGFKRALAKIELGKVKSVRTAIKALVCQRNYYYLQRGDKPIYPQMQKKIENILHLHGLPLPVEFDHYEWHYKWNEES